MKRWIAVWAVMAMWTAMGCIAHVTDTEREDAPPLEAQQVGRFSASLFRFTVLVPDDGHDPGGGWQTAFAVLKFPAIKPGLQCPVRIGMPIRSQARGVISPALAAEITAEVATDAAKILSALHKDWVSSDFCYALRESMYTLYRQVHNIPATATQS